MVASRWYKSGSGQAAAAAAARSCECGNKPSGSIKCGEFCDQMRNYQLLKKDLFLDPAPLSTLSVTVTFSYTLRYFPGLNMSKEIFNNIFHQQLIVLKVNESQYNALI